LSKIYNFYLFFLIFYTPLYASKITNEELLKLSQERTWLKLLYFDTKDQKSELVSDDYFLAKDGKTDPKAELEATLAAYAISNFKDPNKDARCRFPARYKWLNDKIGLDNFELIPDKCTNLKKSFDETEVDSISLMFVSGYLGNPASSFGHSFIKLNNSLGDSENLFDLSISYGADVPKNENVISYMYNGVAGGYTAAFKDKYFFSQDLIYTRNEFRDIWEYKLKLNSDQIQFLKLHLWEILNKKFIYLFLNKNCGYEISRLLEVIVKQKIVHSANFWFVPIESFYALNDNNSTLVDEKIYHPSEQKIVYKRFQQLSKSEQKIVTYLYENKMDYPKELYGALTDQNKIHVINFMLTYYTYLLSKEREDKELKKLKRKALLARFMLIPKKESKLVFETSVAPDENDKPSIISVAANYSKEKKFYTTLGFTPYAIKSLGRNNLNGDELVVLDGEVGVSKENIFLKKFDLISIKQFNRYSIPLEDISKFSWQLKIGVKNLDTSSSQYDGLIKAGIGKTWLLNDLVFSYAMLNLSAHTFKKSLLCGPEFGIRFDLDDTKIRTSLELSRDIVNNKTIKDIGIKANTKIDKNLALYFDFKYNNQFNSTSTLGLQYFY